MFTQKQNEAKMKTCYIFICLGEDSRKIPYDSVRKALVFDTFTKRLYVKGGLPWDRPWVSNSSKHLWTEDDDEAFFMQSRAGIIIDLPETFMKKGNRLLSKESIVAMLHYDVKQSKCINSLADYITAEKWDGTERLDTIIIKALGAEDTTLNREKTMKWFVGLAARILSPGTKLDLMLILYGKPGIGKTSFFETIGTKYNTDGSTDFRFYSTALSDLRSFHGKEYKELLRDTPIAIFDELTYLLKKDNQNQLKKILTDRTIDFTAKYEKRMSQFDITSVFCGTTNEDPAQYTFLNDRRFMSMEVGVNEPTVNVIKDKNPQLPNLQDMLPQLFAEAVYLYKSGYKFWEEPEKDMTRFNKGPIKVLKEHLNGKNKFFPREFVTFGNEQLQQFAAELKKTDAALYGKIFVEDGNTATVEIRDNEALTRYVNRLMKNIPDWSETRGSCPKLNSIQRGWKYTGKGETFSYND